MHKCKYATVFALLSMAVMLTNGEEIAIVLPDPCALQRCEIVTQTCIVFTKDCNPGETHCAKCIDCPALDCRRGGCQITKPLNECPTCYCAPINVGGKEKY